MALLGIARPFDQRWAATFVGLGLCLAGSVLLYRARQYQLRARRSMMPTAQSFERYTPGQYVLYLRAFDKDTDLGRITPLSDWRLWFLPGTILGYADPQRSFLTTEERNVAELSRFGEVVAVGRPRENKPFLGADRVYVTKSNWKSVVTDAMTNARLVVIVAAIGPDRTRYEGTLWEYTEALRLIPPQQVVLLLHHPDEYENFRRQATGHFRKRAKNWRRGETTPDRAPLLPPVPLQSPDRGQSGDWPLRGLIRFDQGWNPRLCLPEAGRTWFALTRAARIRRAVREHIAPELDAVESALPGTAESGRHGLGAGFYLLPPLVGALFAGWWWANDLSVTVTLLGLAIAVSGIIGYVRFVRGLSRAERLRETRITP